MEDAARERHQRLLALAGRKRPVLETEQEHLTQVENDAEAVDMRAAQINLEEADADGEAHFGTVEEEAEHVREQLLSQNRELDRDELFSCKANSDLKEEYEKRTAELRRQTQEAIQELRTQI